MRMLRLAPSSASLKLAINPSSFRIRAISIFTLEAGTSTLGWRAICALRMRVSISPMGSDVSMRPVLSLPARLDHAGDFARQRQLPEADAAQIELAQIASRTAAAEAAVTMPDPDAPRAILRRHQDFCLFFFRDLGCSGHSVFILALQPLLAERHSHKFQQREPFGIRLRRGCDRNIHPFDLL